MQDSLESVLGHRFRRPELLEEAPAELDERLPGACRDGTAALPDEQRLAQLVLEQLVLTGDVAARRRLARDAISSAHEAVSRQVTALKKARKLEGVEASAWPAFWNASITQ